MRRQRPLAAADLYVKVALDGAAQAKAVANLLANASAAK
jgi:hypothetical protein